MNTMSNARQIPRLSLSDQIAEVMLVREAYQKRATDLSLKGQKPELAAKLSATTLNLGHVVDTLKRMETLEKIIRQMVTECL